MIPATGDWVALADDPTEGWAVLRILPRRSVISRRHPEDAVREQVLAANVDVVGVVCALDRPFGENRLERFLAVAWDSGALPAVILTKADAFEDVEAITAAALAVAPGADVFATSAVSGLGMDDLRSLLASGRTLVLLGPSGAGKSTLVNRLVGHDVQATGEVREDDRRGRHTTTTRDLIPVPSGGMLIDTPGLRSLSVWDADTEAAPGFPDIEELAAGCRFRDCSHEGEPGCAVDAAVRDGTLDARRLVNFLKLRRETAALDVARDERARREAGRKGARAVRKAKIVDLTAHGVHLFNRIGEIEGHLRFRTSLEQKLQRLPVGVSVLAVAGEDVVLGRDPAEEISLVIEVPNAAVMGHLEDADVDRLVFAADAALHHPLQDLVAPGVARQQDGLAAGAGQEDDARQVRNRLVVQRCEHRRSRPFRRGLLLEPLVEVLLEGHQLSLARADDDELDAGDLMGHRFPGRSLDEPPTELLVDRDLQSVGQPPQVVAL
ncbi:MAG: ribosome small subunit-dependent GTPase A, partial [Actinobacteria bacterium]|nr:ribosome small subunit-dependent GTPase A [Actinomycetota bacterium]